MAAAVPARSSDPSAAEPTLERRQLRTRLGVAVSEVAFQDLWQRARLTAALTGGSLGALQDAAGGVERWVYARWPEHVTVRTILTAGEELDG